jgi:hypothetical protein
MRLEAHNSHNLRRLSTTPPRHHQRDPRGTLPRGEALQKALAENVQGRMDVK